MKRVPVLLAALALAGCGAETEPSSVENFEGEERAVAQKVEDLQEAGEGRNPEDICSDILSRTLVEQLEAAGTTCAEEMGTAIDDADDFALDVRDVTVSGSTARAEVRQDGESATFELERDGESWRISSFGAAG